MALLTQHKSCETWFVIIGEVATRNTDDSEAVVCEVKSAADKESILVI